MLSRPSICTLTVLLFLTFAMTVMSDIYLPNCQDGLVSIKLKDSMTGKADNTTLIFMCHYPNTPETKKTRIDIYWENNDTDIIANFEKCNDPLYKEDAVEIFISNSATFPPKDYVEIQVSPRSTLFISNIHNENGDCSKFSGKPMSCDLAFAKAQIFHTIWTAYLNFSIEQIFQENVQEAPQANPFVYLNLFRIDKSSTKPTKYLSMNPTYTETPCFHVPNKFQKFILAKKKSQNISVQKEKKQEQ